MPRGANYRSTRNYRVSVGGAVNLRKQQARLNADVRYMRTLINSEMNRFTLVTSNNIDSVGQIVSLNDIPQGDNLNFRTGTSILPRYLTIHMSLNKSLTGPAHETFRVMLFRFWGSQSTATPAVLVSDILQSIDPRSMLNDDNTGSKGDRERRIEVHKSKFFTLDNVSDTKRAFNWNINVNGKHVTNKQHIKYKTSTTESPVSGGFWLLFLSDNATGANKAAYNFTAATGYYDN